MVCGILSFLTRDRTCASCSGSRVLTTGPPGNSPFKWASGLPSWILWKFTDFLKVSVGLSVFGLSSAAWYLRSLPTAQRPSQRLQKMKAMTDTQNEVGGLVLKFTGFWRSAHMPLFNKNATSCFLPACQEKLTLGWGMTQNVVLVSSQSPFPSQLVEDPAREQGLFPIVFVSLVLVMILRNC